MMGLLTALYTSMGGIKSVIWTDAIQVGMVCVGLIVVAVAAVAHLSGGTPSFWSTAGLLRQV
jgi:solute:Na+ symporter, SSS family